MQGVAADVMVIPCSFSCSIQSIFLFQAGDGIRDGHVTGVQTCALPIYKGELLREISQLKTAIQLKEAEAIMTLGGEQAESDGKVARGKTGAEQDRYRRYMSREEGTRLSALGGDRQEVDIHLYRTGDLRDGA